MTHPIEQFGKAMTAIAAVLAFSSTPLLAQETAPEPEVDTSAEASPTADPLAPEPLASDPPAEATAPPAPQPKVESAPTRAERSSPRATRAATRPTVRRTSASAPAAVAPAAPAAPSASAQQPAEPSAAAIPAVPPAPIAAPAPPVAANEAQAPDLMGDDMLPIAGAAALALLALGGAGIAARRRKRRRDAEEFEARQQALATIEDEPVMELGDRDEVRPGPAFVRAPAPMHDPVPDRNAAVAGVPDGFDTSRFGRHVQAAYRGPTADNPSVSLEYRLRRAAALDEQERAGGTVESRDLGLRQGNWESRRDRGFMIRPAGKPAKDPADH